MNECFLVGLGILAILGVVILGVKNQQDIAAEYSVKCSSVGGHTMQFYEGKEKVLGCFLIQRVEN